MGLLLDSHPKEAGISTVADPVGRTIFERIRLKQIVYALRSANTPRLVVRASSSSSSDDFDGWGDDDDDEDEDEDEEEEETDGEGDGAVYDWTVMDTGGEAGKRVELKHWSTNERFISGTA